jgi:hypothetical protein
MTTLDSQQLLEKAVLIAHRGGSTLDATGNLVLEDVLAGGKAGGDEGGAVRDEPPKSGGGGGGAPAAANVGKISNDALANLDAIATTQSNLYAQDWDKAMKNARRDATQGKSEGGHETAADQ